MLLAAVFAVALATVPPLGGRLGALGDLALRRSPLVIAAVVLQVGALTVAAGAPPALPRAAHLASYAVLGVFLWSNRSVPGLALAGLGGALNALAITVNGGVMPASPAALQEAGMPPVLERFTNSAAVEEARLPWLGDVFAIPAELPLSTVFSAGDVVIAVGVAYGLHAICGSRAGAAVRRRLRGGGASAWPRVEAGPKPRLGGRDSNPR